MSDDYETLIERLPAPSARFSLADEMFVERGDKSDWDLMHDLHYKAENLPFGPKIYKLSLRGETIGACVVGSPQLMVKERHVVFPNLKPGRDTRFTNTTRANYINANFRVISRIVTDTMYRGIGTGYRFMNLVSRMEGITFMEIQSSMSKFNYFGQKAGFRFVEPMNATKFEQGLKFFRSHFKASPQDYMELVKEIEATPEPGRSRLVDACRHFYLRNSSRENTGSAREGAEARVAAMDVSTVIKAIQQMALASPMYGIYKVPDKKGSVPARLPLMAFDWQKPSEPLRV